MHLPDGFLSPAVAGVTGAASLVAVGAALRRVDRDLDDRQVPLIGTLAAFVFAAQMLTFPVAAGTSGHVLGAGLVAALLGPAKACLVLALVLVIQALAFGDGGVTALGANVFNLGLVGGLVAWSVLRIAGAILPRTPGAVAAAAGVAAWASVVAASAACALELALSGTSPLGLVLPAMTGVHAVIGIGEGLVTASVVAVVAAARPDLVQDLAPAPEEPGARPPGGGVLGPVLGLAIAGLALVLASPLASSAPDGLERVAADQGFDGPGEGAPLWTRAPMPDYVAPGLDDERAATIAAGLVGMVLILALAGVVAARRRSSTSA